MAKPYSMELRDRVVMSVVMDGMSRHAAAARFGLAMREWLLERVTRAVEEVPGPA